MTSPRRSFNWQEIRERLAIAQRGTERAMEPDEQTVESVYRQRAAELAGRGRRSNIRANVPLLCFTVRAERCAIELEHLAEIVPLESWARLPGAPPEVVGVINVRGEIRGVVDLARMMGMPVEAHEPTQGYVLALRHVDVHLRVDDIEGIRWLPANDPALRGTARDEMSSRYVRGLTRDGLVVLSYAELRTHPILQSARTT